MRRHSLVYLIAFAFFCIQCAQDNGKKHQGHARVSPDALRNSGQPAINSKKDLNGNKPADDSDVVRTADAQVAQKAMTAKEMRDFLISRSTDDNAHRVLVTELPAGKYTLQDVITNFDVQDSTVKDPKASTNGAITGQVKSLDFVEFEDFGVVPKPMNTKLNFVFTLQSTQISDASIQSKMNLVRRPLFIESSFEVGTTFGTNPVHANTMVKVTHGFVGGQPQTLTEKSEEVFSGIINALSALPPTSNKAYKKVLAIPEINVLFLSLVNSNELHVTLEITEKGRAPAMRRILLSYKIEAPAVTETPAAAAVAPTAPAAKVDPADNQLDVSGTATDQTK